MTKLRFMTYETLKENETAKRITEAQIDKHLACNPLEKLMLLHLSKQGGTHRSAGVYDLTDACYFMGPFVGGHKAWHNAQMAVTWITLDGLWRMGLVLMHAESRKLGHRGWHYGLWRLSETGCAAADRLEGKP